MILITSIFLFTSCATVSERANSAYDYVAGGVTKGYNSVKDAVTGGNVEVGEFSAIGIGATVKHNVSIGYNCIIGASSLVNKDTKSNSVYYGIPARFIRNHELGKKYL